MTKEKLIEELDKEKDYKYKELKHLINSISVKPNVPSEFKVGDVYNCKCGGKNRPSVIIKVYDNYVISIPLSTTEDDLNLCRYKSRFFGEGYFSKTLLVAKKIDLDDLFLGVFDNPDDVEEAIHKIKNFVDTFV